MLPSPLIFVDVDGVLNTHATAMSTLTHSRLADADTYFAPGEEQFMRSKGLSLSRARLATLGSLVHALDCRIVISSSWRVDPGAKRVLLAAFDHAGGGIRERVVGCTPELAGGSRADEVLEWLAEERRREGRHRRHEPAWVAIDDMDLGGQRPDIFLPSHFVLTKIGYGLTTERAAEAERLLREQHCQLQRQQSATSTAVKVPAAAVAAFQKCFTRL